MQAGPGEEIGRRPTGHLIIEYFDLNVSEKRNISFLVLWVSLSSSERSGAVCQREESKDLLFFNF